MSDGGYGSDDNYEELEVQEPDQHEHNSLHTAVVARISEAEKEWNSLKLEDQCKDVLDLLSRNKRRWDNDADDEGAPPLEEYKKRTLAERRGNNIERTKATALHILACSKTEFEQVPKDVCVQLVHYLLENHVSADETQSLGGKNRMLVIRAALIYENNQFIACVKECLGERFPGFLHLQDDRERNCLHYLFLWPLERDGKDPKRVSKTAEDNARYLSQLGMLAFEAKPETLATADADGNTPIHYAMHAKQCYDRGDKYVDIVKTLILQADEHMINSNTVFNKKRESPVMYCHRSYKELMSESNKAKQDRKQKQATDAPTQTKVPSAQVEGSGPQKNSMKLSGQGVVVENRLAIGVKGQVQKESAASTASTDFPQGHQLRKVPTCSSSQDTNLGQYQSQMPPPDKKRGAPNRGPNAGDAKAASWDGASRASTSNIKHMKAFQSLSEFLRMHYTGTRPDLDARDVIYGRGADGWAKNLYFDARGLQETTKILELLDRMKAGGFGATLSYVSIPAIRHAPTSPLQTENFDLPDQSAPPENPRLGRTDLIGVFDKLRELKVTYIWRLDVEDRVRPSHTDAAIERAIQGKDSTMKQEAATNPETTMKQDLKRPISIHTWDWRKLDLSTDVIAFAAPAVKVVHLYWSGNQTVLKAWGCSEGIPTLHSITDVEKICIHISPGLETMDRMKMAVRHFKIALKAEIPFAVIDPPFQEKEDECESKEIYSKSVEVKFILHMGDPFIDDTSKETPEYTDDSAGRQHSWVDAMDKFRGALASMLLPMPIPKERVRVALIDDGVNLGSVDMYGNIANITGLSFHPPGRHTENPWHCSSGGHGTVMANMILRINPWVDLIVIKLHCGVSHNQRRTISARSAAGAIRAAIDFKVKIISVSWTIEYSSETEKVAGAKRNDLNLLKESIDEVKRQGILMFCSASDDIQTTAMRVLPYSRQPEHIFRIGAALSLGQRDPMTENPDRIDWYFPGNQVAEARNPRSQAPVKYHDGSSAGTALAAGLASLIMFLARLVKEHYTLANDAHKAKEFEGFAQGLEDRTRMKQALEAIRKKGNFQHDPKFLPVWATFNAVTDTLTQTKDPGVRWKKLEDLVRSLCSEGMD
ncbi:hypothetical protein F4802DRAFT_19209 [Xylaria palmicola]|nr:hypothetical protein F4802DRAFT_19209 [Xylaria palmicola]